MPSFKEFKNISKQYGQSSGNEWFRPTVGLSKIRVVSNYEVIGKHWDVARKRSVVCVGKDSGCSYCIKSDDYRKTVLDSFMGKTDSKEYKEKIRENPYASRVNYLLWVIDRNDNNTLKIAELSHPLMKLISDLQANPEYQFETIPEFDIYITKTKTGDTAKDVKYSIQPARQNSALTEEEVNEFSFKTPISDIAESMKNKVLQQMSQSSEEILAVKEEK